MVLIDNCIKRAILTFCSNDKVTQADLAAKIGVSRSLLSHWLSGRRATITEKTWNQLKTVLNDKLPADYVPQDTFSNALSISDDADAMLIKLMLDTFAGLTKLDKLNVIKYAEELKQQTKQ